MKYLGITIFLIILPFSSFAQIIMFGDDFENYVTGKQLACQNPVDWTTWSLSPCDSIEDPYISTAYAFSGANSVLISYWNDLVKPLNNLTTGFWFLFIQVYIPSDETGYFAILTVFDPPSNMEWGMECYFDPDGQGKLITGLFNQTNFSYEYDTWQMIKIAVQLDFGTSEFWINENLIHTWDWTDGGILTNQLAAINFFGYPNPEMYVDNFFIYDLCLSCTAPNPPTNLSAQLVLNPIPLVKLNWKDNSDDEYIFKILRKNGYPYDPGDYEIISRVSYNVTEYFDTNVVVDSTYTYGVIAYNLIGNSDTSNTVTIIIDPITNVNQIDEPLTYSLEQNYPNPFNPTTKISYQIPELSFITLKVYDVLGNEIITLVNEEKSVGSYEVQFDGANLTSGIYVYRIQAGSFIQTKKMIMLK